VGPVLNVACAAGKVRMEEILKPTMPYFIAQCILLFMMTLIPEMILLPLKWIAGYVPRVPVPSLLNYF
jgi:TRAP-type transport system large permease protein